MTDSLRKESSPDGDEGKGAVESDRPTSRSDSSQNESNESMAGQLGHRDQDSWMKENDTDYPEPDAEAEHSGT